MSRPSYVASRHNQHTGPGQVSERQRRRRTTDNDDDEDDDDDGKRETASGRSIECVLALKSMHQVHGGSAHNTYKLLYYTIH